MGGGSILVIILTTFMLIEQHIAQAANLIFFIPTAITAIIVHFKNGNVEKKVGIKILITIVIGAVAGAILTSKIQSKNMRQYFGIFLLGVGILEMIITITKIIKSRKENVK